MVYRRGFTLIELLVVIAIIGLLSSIVLASLNTARTKGKDAAVKSNLEQIRTQAALVYSNQTCYGDNDGGTICANRTSANTACASALTTANTLFNEATVMPQITAATKNGGANSGCRETGGGQQWAVAVQLSSNNLTAWCVDSSGYSGSVTLATNNQNGLDQATSATGLDSGSASNLAGCSNN